MNLPKVSVRLMTYNHEAYIRQAMDSIMMQEIDFPVEVVVGDDFSTDSTLEIIKSYQNTKYITITILARKKGDEYWVKRQERGRLYNFENIVENCKGEYIALLDGDDYWSDPHKLKKQVDHLDNNKDIALVHTSNLIYHEKKSKLLSRGKVSEIKDNDYFFTLLIGNVITTPTVMVKNDAISSAIEILNKEIVTHKIMDYPLWLEIASHDKIDFIQDITAVYRLQDNTASRPDNIEKKYRYIENVFQIKEKFCEIKGVDKNIQKRIMISFLRKKLFYSFYVMDDKTSVTVLNEIKKHCGRNSLNDKLKYFGSKYKIMNVILKKFLTERSLI